MSKWQKYKRWDWFMVPIAGALYFGRIVQKTRAGNLFVYVFGPFGSSAMTTKQLDGLAPKNAMLKTFVGDLRIRNSEWSVIEAPPPADEHAWEMPEFGHKDLISGKAVARRYDPVSLEFISEREISRFDYEQLPRDGLHGAKALEIELLLSGGGAIRT